jgi:hypothetical protein
LEMTWRRFARYVVHLSNSPPYASTASRSRRTVRASLALSFAPPAF